MDPYIHQMTEIRHNKDPIHDPATRNKFNIKQENNAIFNHQVDEIILHEVNKVSAESEARENLNLS